MKEVGQARDNHNFIFLNTWVSVLQKGAENSSGEEEAKKNQIFGDQACHNSETRTVKGIGSSVHTLWNTTTTQRDSWSPCIYVPWIPGQCIRRFRRWLSIEMWKEVGIPSICRHRGWTGCLSLFQHVVNSWIPFAELVQKTALLFWEFACNPPRMLSVLFLCIL